MKLTKKILNKVVKTHICNLGYREFHDSIIGSQGYYAKKLENGLYLSLGLTIHRFYDSLFAPSFYLSSITTWSTLGYDIPFDIYPRLGQFLTKEERTILLDTSINGDEGWDAWFDASQEKNIENFIKVVIITENRFVNNDELIEKINKSSRLNSLSKLAQETQECFRKKAIYNDLKYTPKTEKDQIPLIWFQAAESAIMNLGWDLCKNYVEIIASDAYIKYRLNEQ